MEFLNDSGTWQVQEPSLDTPGFRLSLLALLLCQHFYLVANARERSVPLHQVEGAFTVTTSADWMIQEVSGHFQLKLRPGAAAEELARADEEALAFIRRRMQLCPVSRNLPTTVKKVLTLEWAGP